MLVKGDKIKLVNPMGSFTNIGEVCEVLDVDKNGVVSFKFGGYHKGMMSYDEFEKYFEKVNDTNKYEIGSIVSMTKENKELAPMEVGNNYIIQSIKYNVVTLYSVEDEEYYNISFDILEKYFERYEEPKHEESCECCDECCDDCDECCECCDDCDFDEEYEHILDIMDNAEYTAFKVFDKCTIVACKLLNGFVIVESSSCVDPNDYNANIGIENCIDRIESKIRELEAYKRSDETYEDEDCVNSYLDCNNCEDDSCHYCINKND